MNFWCASVHAVDEELMAKKPEMYMSMLETAGWATEEAGRHRSASSHHSMQICS
jgi:hypothetical protein